MHGMLADCFLLPHSPPHNPQGQLVTPQTKHSGRRILTEFASMHATDVLAQPCSGVTFGSSERTHPAALTGRGSGRPGWNAGWKWVCRRQFSASKPENVASLVECHNPVQYHSMRGASQPCEPPRS